MKAKRSPSQDDDLDAISRLEASAKRIRAVPPGRGELPSPLETLNGEIALNLAHMERLRAVNDDQILSLLKMECYTDTELIQMEQRTPRYSPYRFPEREKLQRRLVAIETERRKLATNLEEKLRPLREQLFALMTKRSYVKA